MEGEYIISGRSVRNKMKRSRAFLTAGRIVALVALFAAVVGKEAGLFSSPWILLLAHGLVMVMIVLTVISAGGKGRTCMHCGCVLTEKQVLAMPDEDFACPNCGELFQVKLNKEEINL